MLFTVSQTLSLKRNAQKLYFQASALTSQPKRGTMKTTGLKQLDVKMRKVSAAENGFISKTILNVLRKVCIPTKERKPAPGNITTKMEVQEVSRIMKPEK